MHHDGCLNAIDALIAARAKLETVLRKDAHWLALGKATLPANRAAHERALADNPVFQAWRLLVRAIAQLEAETPADPMGRVTSPGAIPSHAAAQAKALTEPRARQPRVELRHVLERLRAETTFDAPKPPAAASGRGRNPEAAARGPVIPPADIEIEEAAVSFVVREPVAASREETPAEPAAAARDAGASPAIQDGAAGAESSGEAEVTIVRRR